MPFGQGGALATVRAGGNGFCWARLRGDDGDQLERLALAGEGRAPWPVPGASGAGLRRSPGAAALRRIPPENRGMSGPDGVVEVGARGLAGEVQLTVARVSDGDVEILHTQMFASPEALPQTLYLRVGAAGPARPIGDPREPAGPRRAPRYAATRHAATRWTCP